MNPEAGANPAPIRLQPFEPAHRIDQHAASVSQIQSQKLPNCSLMRSRPYGESRKRGDGSSAGAKALPSVGAIEPPMIARNHEIPGIAGHGEAEVVLPRGLANRGVNVPGLGMLVESADRGRASPAEANPTRHPFGQRPTTPRGVKRGGDAVAAGFRDVHVNTLRVIPPHGQSSYYSAFWRGSSIWCSISGSEM